MVDTSTVLTRHPQLLQMSEGDPVRGLCASKVSTFILCTIFAALDFWTAETSVSEVLASKFVASSELAGEKHLWPSTCRWSASRQVFAVSACANQDCDGGIWSRTMARRSGSHAHVRFVNVLTESPGREGV